MSSKSGTPLNYFITLQRGFDLPSQDRKNGNVPIVASTGVVGTHDEIRVKAPGVVIGRSGSIGGGQYVTTDFWPLNTTLWVKDFKGHNPRYIYYLLKNIDFKQFNVGSGVPTLNRNHLSSVLVKNIGLEQEGKLASIVGVIDDKIELNNQINQTLEAMAQAIFKSWFVDFEPVKAKMAVLQADGSQDEAELAAMMAISGKTAEQLNTMRTTQAEAYQQLTQTAALFPAAMQDSELGEIPEGWGITNLGSATLELRRGISPSYTDSNGVLVINQKCIRDHKINFGLARLNDPIKKSISGRLIEVGDVLVNSTGVGTLGRLSPVRYLKEPTVVDSHVTVIRVDPQTITKSFLGGLMLENEKLIEASGSGSTGQTELNKQVLENIIFAQPSMQLNLVFDAISQKLNSKIGSLEQESETLIQLRDNLLPKLLSGEIDLSAIDEDAA